MRRLMLVLPIAVVGLMGCKKDSGPVLEIPCSQNVASLRYGPGATFVANCPEDCGSASKVWGDGLYTKDSPICKASIHAGVISKSGGKVKVTVQPGQDSYKGSTKNGITTEPYGSFGGSYTVADP
ncbi:MAG: protease [Myxococcaceae bacterium]|nr:protease [Myxococcaceae bacterium]